jgi:hypothetical protein
MFPNLTLINHPTSPNPVLPVNLQHNIGRKKKKNPLASMGVLAPGSAHACFSLDNRGNKHLPQLLRRHIWSFGTLGQLLKIAPSATQNLPSANFLIGILIFLLVKSPCKISYPYDNPFWEKSKRGGKKKKERKNAVNSGHLKGNPKKT